jgi:hypothetical protein
MSRHVVALVCTVVAGGCLDDADPELDFEAQELARPSAFTPTQISAVHSNLCWDLPAQAGGPFMLQQFECHSGGNQRWEMLLGPGNVSTIMVSGSNACLDVPNANVVSGQDLQISLCNFGNNQKWVIEPGVTSATIHPYSDLGLCVDVESASPIDARIQIHSCNGQANQQFKFRTVLQTVQVAGCTSSVNAGAKSGGSILNPAVVAVGTRKSLYFGQNLATRCNTPGTLVTTLAGCPVGTNSAVIDRVGTGTGPFPIVCLRE